MNSKTVAIVVPTYNRIRYLKRALKLILAQTYEDFRVYVYDNASTDGTREYLERAAAEDERIIPYRHAVNIGAANNFAFGMQRVSEPFFTILADDDCPLPRFLEVAMKQFERWPDIGFAAGGTLEMTDAGKFLFAPLAFWPRAGLYEPGENIRDFLNGRHPSWNTIVFRRDVLDEIGLMDPRQRLTFDLEFTVRVALSYPYAIDFEPCGIFVRHSQSSSEFADERVIDDYLEMLQVLGALPSASADSRRDACNMLQLTMKDRMQRIVVKSIMNAEWERALNVADRAKSMGFSSVLFTNSFLNGGRLVGPLVRKSMYALAAIYQARVARGSVVALRDHGFELDLKGYAMTVSSLPS